MLQFASYGHKKEAHMALEARIRELSLRHYDLDCAIEAEMAHPAADTFRVAAMKKEKLRLKDEIATLERRH